MNDIDNGAGEFPSEIIRIHDSTLEFFVEKERCALDGAHYE